MTQEMHQEQKIEPTNNTVDHAVLDTAQRSGVPIDQFGVPPAGVSIEKCAEIGLPSAIEAVKAKQQS